MTKEEIREKAIKYCETQYGHYNTSIAGAFIDSAEWMQEKMIEKVVKWLRKNIDEDVSVPCGNVIKIISADEFVEYFAKSMEEEK